MQRSVNAAQLDAERNLVAEPELRSVLAVAASRESYLLDYGNERSRFMFNFGGVAVAALLVKDHPANEVLGSHGPIDAGREFGPSILLYEVAGDGGYRMAINYGVNRVRFQG